MTLKELRRVIDRIDHKHDEKLVVLSGPHDYTVDKDTNVVSDHDRVFIFLDELE